MPDRYIMEKRRLDGALDLSEPQPPFLECTKDQLFAHYYRANPGDESVSQETIQEWYQAQGFTWRRKTW